MSTDVEGWITVERAAQGEWARITMAREPVNSMNYAFWKRLTDVLHTCEQAPDIRGVIFCSGLKRPVFTAGNDLSELYAPVTSRDRYRRFWKMSNEFVCSLYNSPLLTVCAVKGACPAGGCAIALACDYRVMTDSGRIGLNEVELGIPVPKYWQLLMGRVVTTGVAEKLCGFAQMLTPQRALDVGMIDEVSTSGQLMQAAEAAMAAMLKLPDVGRIVNKQQARGDFVEAWLKFIPWEAEVGFSQLQLPATVEALRAVRERLSGGAARSRL